ncbi:type II secretion system protein [Candidatus Saccharibacteria bacterium]|jgi:prepilin-type N-terminal cleavage/methylation domain-containing protein|nr:type II secretion system protein [Candidatus Saccharibacteria bacterium]
MAKQNINSKQGFTIIEVVLVLAIAGLIFLMVFVALPALQRSQRDTARRNDLARVDTSLVQYQTNNQGTNAGSNLPFTSKVYMGAEDFNDTNACGKRPETESESSSTNNMSCIFIRDYMNAGTAGSNKKNEFQDPAGTYYGMDITHIGEGGSAVEYKDLQYVAGGDATKKDGTTMDYVVHVLTGARCNGETAVGDTARHFAIIYRLEGAGTYCIDDQ